MAICYFTLGYIYATFSKSLSSKQVAEKVSPSPDADVNQYGKSCDQCNNIEKARGYFMKAYESFDKVNHHVGKYLSIKQFVKIGNRNKEEHDRKERELNDLLHNLQEYHRQYNIGSSCFNYREQGEEISLMTELVLLVKDHESLFPEKANVKYDLKTRFALNEKKEEV